ncbi:MAG: DMT family transporter, partial [Candidatus Cloacimonadaceae bacterium]
MKKLGSEALLLLTAGIWGLAFVAQRQGAEYMDPLLFNGVRFTLGAFVVGLFAVKPFGKKNCTPVEPFSKRLKQHNSEHLEAEIAPFGKRSYTAAMPFPWLLGSVLFIAATLQQIGIVYTTAGSAGFITGLYVVFVPLLGIFRKQRISRTILTAILLAVIGLYFINVQQPLTASLGNFIVLISAVFWAWHVQMIDHYTR